jgi:hypothetical protein
MMLGLGLAIGGGVFGGFRPTQVANCVLWLRADLGVTLDGSNNVQQWNDQSSGGWNATQGTAANRPGYSSNGGPNGTAYTSWVGGLGAHLLANASFTALPQPFEYFVAARAPGSTASNKYLIDFGAGNKNALLATGNTTTIEQFDGSVGGTITTTAADVILDAYFNGASSFLALNGGTQNTGNPGTATAANGYTVGNFAGSGFEWGGRIYEVAVYSAQVSSTDRLNITRYMGARYGITVP